VTTDTKELAREFDELWNAYPRPTQRPRAHLAYLVARKQGATLEQMLAALAWQRTQPGWVKNGGQFIPSLKNWLDDQRWHDRAPEQPVVSTKTLSTMRAIYGD